MTLIVTSEFELNRVVAPRLLTAPAEYEARYHDQFADVLRLYFNRLDNILGQLETKTTTATLVAPCKNLPGPLCHKFPDLAAPKIFFLIAT